jgi:molybdenum cofactor guanylyltransferase
MGQNKALLEFRGKPLIQRQIELLIGANDSAPYAALNVRVVPDLLAERCALTGIHALLKAATYDRVFVVACDMPYLHETLIGSMLSFPGEFDVIVPQSDRGPEPLHAIYRKTCIPAIEQAAARGAWKVTDFYATLRIDRPRVRDADWNIGGFSPFLNANTPDEWRTAAP